MLALKSHVQKIEFRAALQPKGGIRGRGEFCQIGEIGGN